MDSGVTVNYKHKDRLFKFIFGMKENALSLYNAVNGSHYTNAEDLEYNTIDDFLYMGMQNDLSFLFQSYLSLYEHQSTLSANLPLRGLSYFARVLESYVSARKLNIYSTKLIRLPALHYAVFYNGSRSAPDVQELRLSDAFEKPGSCVELIVKVYNINAGHNEELMRHCGVLSEYAGLVEKIRTFEAQGHTLETAIQLAVDACIHEGILADILTKHKAEVVGMLFTEYDEAKTMQMFREEAYEDGRKDGFDEGEKKGRKDGFDEGEKKGRKDGFDEGEKKGHKDGFDEGEKKGAKKGLLTAIRNLMRKLNATAEECMELLDVPIDQRAEYAALILKHP